MIISITQIERPNVYHMLVVASHHRPPFEHNYTTMDEVWTAARQVSEAEANYWTARNKGWGP